MGKSDSLFVLRTVGLFLSITTLAMPGVVVSQPSDSLPMEAYLDLPLEDLLSLEVTSVSKKRQPLSEAPAAIYVITQDDIKRSGVTSIPEALRMAPGVQVTRINSNKWAVSSRGFNGQMSNKLLLLIDGRSVYTPAFSGVYWDVQDTFMDDIERIEVIRGPGATLWGANAVNGIINVITKSAGNTQGGLLTLGAGSEEKGFAGFRYGASLGDHSQGRFYLKAFDRDGFSDLATGTDAGDQWKSYRAGFRIDGGASTEDGWTFQGDIYHTDENQYVASQWVSTPPFNLPDDDNFNTTGWNLLTRWNHHLSDRSSMTLQLYYDHAERDELILGQTHDTFDLDFQHNLMLGNRHDVIWGFGYRAVKDDFDNTFAVSLSPDSRTNHLISAFVQDQIELVPDRFHLTVGSKIEHNDYTGFEVQPSVKMLWTPHERHTLWGSVSRAVRTPSRVEASGQVVIVGIPPTIKTISGSTN